MAVGEPVPMLDAVARVTGSLPYAANLRLPGMLVARVLRSPLPHARIARLNTSAAAALPGVAAIVTAADLGQPGSPGLYYGVQVKDQPILAHERVRYVGEPVALVAAEDQDSAAAALRAIVAEYEPLPAVFDAHAALREEAPLLHERCPGNLLLQPRLRHGDLAAGFAQADLVVEETFRSPVAQQVTLEPHVTAAQWAAGQLTVWSATQAPYMVRRVLAELFDLPATAVRVIVPPLGGGYGGKGHIRIEPLVAALAWKLGGRPVKLVLSREEEFVTVTKHAASISIKSGVRRDGTLTARQVTVYWNVGAYADASPGLVGAGLVRVVGPYRIPAVHVDCYAVYTNLPPAGAYRGAMSSQGTWAYESHMDSLARQLGMDPLELRLKNLLRSGEQFCTGETLHDVHFVACLQAAAQGLGWDEPLVQPGGPLRRGRGLAVMMKSTLAVSKSQCRLELDAGGQLTVYTSTVEMGQGAHTALAQIAAEAVGVPLAQVRVVGPDTALTPFDTSTNASRSTTMMGNALLDAGALLKQQLREAAVHAFESPPETLAVDGGAVYMVAQPGERISYAEVLRRAGRTRIEALGSFETQVGLDPETGQGVATPHWHQGAGACEVEVDVETGRVQVLRYYASSYAGRVVNPQLAQLQNDGNVVFGLGPALLEEQIFEHGRVVNANLDEYSIPSLRDLPGELNSVALEGAHGEFHGIGEMTLPPVAPAIANAIYDAVGVRIRALPMTPEAVLRTIIHEQR